MEEENNLEKKQTNQLSLMGWICFVMAFVLWGTEASDIFIAMACLGFSFGDQYRKTRASTIINGIMTLFSVGFAGSHIYRAFSPDIPATDSVEGQLIVAVLWAVVGATTAIQQVRAMRVSDESTAAAGNE